MRHTIHRTNSTLASLILIALLGVCAIGVAQVDTWTRKADLPTPSQALSASVVNGKIYAIGGSGRVRRRSVVEAYDPAVDTWTRKPDMPTPRRRHNTRVLDGKIYAIGGQDSDGNPFSAMEVYDPSTDTWTRKADIPTLRHNFSISVVDGRIYVIGGSIPVDNEFRPLSTVEAYDPATDTCTRKSDMPTPRGFLSTSLVNGKIYAIGGWDGINPISTVEAYGPQTDIWTRKVDMPTPRSDLTTHVVNEKIYAIRGWDGNQWIPTVEAYAPQTDIWTRKTPKPTVSGNFWPLDRSTTVVNAEIYVIGGLTTVGSLVSTSVVEAYDPETDTWTRKADLLVPRHDFATGFVEGQIYVMGGNDGRTNPSVVEAYDTGFGIRVTTVSPKAGQMAGGDHITILGRGFPAGATVTVGGEPLTELKVTDMLITGVTPAGTAGEQDIVITAPGLSDPVRIAPFIYIGPGDLLVTEMTPSTGVQAGGETGSITGSGFQDGVTVKVGEAQATVLLVTPTLITFTLPPGTEGTKDVVVTNPGGRAEILRDAYTYTPFPTISRIAPNEGPLPAARRLLSMEGTSRRGLSSQSAGCRSDYWMFYRRPSCACRSHPAAPGRNWCAWSILMNRQQPWREDLPTTPPLPFPASRRMLARCRVERGLLLPERGFFRRWMSSSATHK